MENQKEKPKYGAFSNSLFMVRTACGMQEKKVLFILLASVTLALGINLTTLFLAPTVLTQVESGVSIGRLLLTIGIFSLVLMLLRALAAYTDTNKLYSRVQVRTGIVAMLNGKGNRTSYPNVQDEKFRALFAKAGDACSSNIAATEDIWRTLEAFLTNALGMIVYLLLLSGVQPLLFGIVLVTSLIGFFVTNHFQSWRFKHREEESKRYNQLFYYSGESKNAAIAKDLRIFGMQPWLMELFRKSLEALDAFIEKANRRELWARLIDLVLTLLRNGAGYAFLIALVLRGEISIPDFVLYFAAVGNFSEQVTALLGSMNTLHKQSLDLSTVREVLEYPELFHFEDGKALEISKDAGHTIELRDVSFRYPGADADTLHNINLTLHPGEKLAVVGLNGAGKTTLVKLICGLLDPTKGTVLLDGADIREYNRRDYYACFSAVFQQYVILPCSVAENIAQIEDGLDFARVKACAEKAGLSEKILSLPKGYETMLNRRVYDDAAELSGGETQKLMLARALYKDASFILLDEPTAALDPIAEAQVDESYNNLTKGKTSVYISHRLASTRFCDRIILIDENRIAEEGTHEVLMAKGGKYASLFEVQSRYYREGGKEDDEE